MGAAIQLLSISVVNKGDAGIRNIMGIRNLTERKRRINEIRYSNRSFAELYKYKDNPKADKSYLLILIIIMVSTLVFDLLFGLYVNFYIKIPQVSFIKLGYFIWLITFLPFLDGFYLLFLFGLSNKIIDDIYLQFKKFNKLSSNYNKKDIIYNEKIQSKLNKIYSEIYALRPSVLLVYISSLLFLNWIMVRILFNLLWQVIIFSAFLWFLILPLLVIAFYKIIFADLEIALDARVFQFGFGEEGIKVKIAFKDNSTALDKLETVTILEIWQKIKVLHDNKYAEFRDWYDIKRLLVLKE